MQVKFIPAQEALAARWAAARLKNPSAFDRLMARVPTKNSKLCWPNGYVCKSKAEPYGAIRFNRKKMRCSRAMYTMFYGDIPHGMCVMHICDTPACVNPRHLRLGTHHENMLDRMRKKRGGDRQGERNGRSKITEDDVRFIRASDATLTELATKYGLTKNAVAYVRSGRTWRHIK